ncbi:MAG: thiamine pyrophosphate-binding protein [Actinomycetota bacterium]
MSGARGTGADRLLAGLERIGVEVAFGLPGVHNLPIWEALGTSPIRMVGVRHEQTAAFAADGYARATGRLGVAVVTTGPGAANTLAGVGEARASGSPVLVIASDIAASLRVPGIWRGVIHEASDQQALFAPLVKRGFTAAPGDRLDELAEVAGATALAAPSGPVYLGVPTDVLGAPSPEGSGSRGDLPAGPSAPDEALVERAGRIVEGAGRIVIWAGGGAVRSGAGGVITALAERLAAPVLTTFGGRGLVPPEHPCAVRWPAHVPEVGALWDEADLAIVIGSDLDGSTTQNWAMPRPPSLLAINVDAADASKNYRVDLILEGDARETTARLLAAVAPRDGVTELRERIGAIDDVVRARIAEEDGQVVAFLDALERVVPDDSVYVVDMCIAGYWLGGFHRIPAPRKLAYPLGWGTLGFGFPAAIGAAVGGVGRVISVCGDGGFLYACGDLATLAQEGLPVTVVLVDDGGYGMLRFDQVQAGLATRGVDLRTPDFVELARSFGVHAEDVDGFGAPFAERLDELVAEPGPNVLVVRAALTPPPTTSLRWYRR